MSDYTPSTEFLRRMYATDTQAHEPFDYRLAEFDRWLAAHDAEVRADERKKAIGDACDRISSACFKARHQQVEVAVLANRNAYTLCESCANAMRAARGEAE